MHINGWFGRPFRRASDFVNKMPFIGKFSVQPILTWAYKAPANEKVYRVSVAILFLAFFVVAHTNQVYGGWRVFLATDVVAFRLFAICYAFANAMVVYTQLYLIFRLLVHAFRFKNARIGNTAVSEINYKYFVLCLVFTGLGQATMILVSAMTRR